MKMAKYEPLLLLAAANAKRERESTPQERVQTRNAQAAGCSRKRERESKLRSSTSTQMFQQILDAESNECQHEIASIALSHTCPWTFNSYEAARGRLIPTWPTRRCLIPVGQNALNFWLVRSYAQISIHVTCAKP